MLWVGVAGSQGGKLRKQRVGKSGGGLESTRTNWNPRPCLPPPNLSSAAAPFATEPHSQGPGPGPGPERPKEDRFPAEGGVAAAPPRVVG